MDGLTGPIHFDEYGTRTDIKLEILNLRNNFFKKVSGPLENKHIPLQSQIFELQFGLLLPLKQSTY